MAVGIEYFMAFDAFTMGWFGALFLFAFLYIFTYLGLRHSEERPWDKALWISSCTFVAALFLAFTSFPSLWSGVVLVVVYALVYKHELKQSKHEAISSFIMLWLLLTIFCLVPDELRLVLMVFSLLYFYILSEIEVRKKEKKAEAKSNGR